MRKKRRRRGSQCGHCDKAASGWRAAPWRRRISCRLPLLSSCTCAEIPVGGREECEEGAAACFCAGEQNQSFVCVLGSASTGSKSPDSPGEPSQAKPRLCSTAQSQPGDILCFCHLLKRQGLLWGAGQAGQGRECLGFVGWGTGNPNPEPGTSISHLGCLKVPPAGTQQRWELGAGLFSQLCSQPQPSCSIAAARNGDGGTKIFSLSAFSAWLCSSCEVSGAFPQNICSHHGQLCPPSLHSQPLAEPWERGVWVSSH